MGEERERKRERRERREEREKAWWAIVDDSDNYTATQLLLLRCHVPDGEGTRLFVLEPSSSSSSLLLVDVVAVLGRVKP